MFKYSSLVTPPPLPKPFSLNTSRKIEKLGVNKPSSNNKTNNYSFLIFKFLQCRPCTSQTGNSYELIEHS